MRLICPNCDAQYEVPDEVIPAEGRDVQCSDCGQTWFQEHSDDMLDDADSTELDEDGDAPGPNEMRVPRALAERAARKVDPDVQAILREEADREAKARAAETIESQPELGLDTAEPEADRRVEQARKRMAKMRGEEEDPKAVATTPGSRRDLLPDIEEINSTLRSTSERGGLPEPDYDEAADSGGRRTGFWTGFILIVLIVAILLGIYVFAPQIARAVPQSDPWLSTYVAQADSVRSWLNTTLLGASEWLEDTAESLQER